MEPTELDERLKNLEASILEQEHRPISAVFKYFSRDDRYPNPKDPRRHAAARGLVFALLFSPASVAAGGGLMLLLSTAILYWQTTLVAESNRLAAENMNLFKDSLHDPSEFTVVLNGRTQWARDAVVFTKIGNTNRTLDEAIIAGIEGMQIRLDTWCSGKKPFMLDVPTLVVQTATLSRKYYLYFNATEKKLEEEVLSDYPFHRNILDPKLQSQFTYYPHSMPTLIKLRTLRGGVLADHLSIGTISEYFEKDAPEDHRKIVGKTRWESAKRTLKDINNYGGGLDRYGIVTLIVNASDSQGDPWTARVVAHVHAHGVNAEDDGTMDVRLAIRPFGMGFAVAKPSEHQY